MALVERRDDVEVQEAWVAVSAPIFGHLELVSVVILSAFVPTLVAQQLFQPTIFDQEEEEEEALGAEDASTIRRQEHRTGSADD